MNRPPNNSMQRTALRAAADAERSTEVALGGSAASHGHSVMVPLYYWSMACAWVTLQKKTGVNVLWRSPKIMFLFSHLVLILVKMG